MIKVEYGGNVYHVSLNPLVIFMDTTRHFKVKRVVVPPYNPNFDDIFQLALKKNLEEDNAI